MDIVRYYNKLLSQPYIESEDVLTLEGDESENVRVIGGIPRFVATNNYAESFGLQWEQFSLIELDSHTGFDFSRERLERCLGGDLGIVKGKSVLEVGCGAGQYP